MSHSENHSEEHPAVQRADYASETKLFAADSGQLAFESRRVLVHLLAGPSLDQRRHPNLWPTLLRDRDSIASRLSELFLELIVWESLGIAFVRQAETTDHDIPTLLRRVPLTYIDSALILHLRHRLARAKGEGDRAVVSDEEMIEHLMPYQPAGKTDHAGMQKRIRASIEKMKKHSLLQKVRGTDDRYEIAPTLELILSAERVQELSAKYAALRSGGGAPPSETDAEEDENGDRDG